MESSNLISLLREKCMKCRAESDILMSSRKPTGFSEFCDHKFCESCFRKENANLAAIVRVNYTFRCPCCLSLYYSNMRSIDEAVLLGEVATIRTLISPHLISDDTSIPREDLLYINEMIKFAVGKLEAALLLNPLNLYSLYLLVILCTDGHRFVIEHTLNRPCMDFYRLKAYTYAFKLFDHPVRSAGYESIRSGVCYDLAYIFSTYRNYPTALKYSKLAYEHRLRSSDHSELSRCKDFYLETRVNFAKLPPLRFAVGDEVEFLHELETGSEWTLGKVVELFYRERDFDINFNAPYRLQLLVESADQPPVYAWVKADIDRYVRKVGVRSIEDTRYQARLDAKVAELARVYCSKEFIQGLYNTLAQESEFVDMLQSVWQIELSEPMLSLYRALVMYRQPLVHTDTGYHVPSTEEVIAGIRAYFDPTHLSVDAVPLAAGNYGPLGEESDLQKIKIDVISILQCDFSGSFTVSADILDLQALLLQSTRNYIATLTSQDPTVSPVELFCRGSTFTVSLEISEAISRASNMLDLRRLPATFGDFARLDHYWHYLNAWIGIQTCLDKSDARFACECPFVYFFVKFCLDQGAGVPKLALALYDRMNMQLSREFIRCANPTCELNKLDQSTGQVKFKQCSRCKAVIYCSRECQVTHYPEHKRLCREHLTC